MIKLAKLATQGVQVPSGHQLLGWIDKHPSGKGGSYTVLHVVQTGVEVAWDGSAIRSLPKNWRDKVEFEAACGPASIRKNITQPADWWQAFEAKATEAGVALSEWVGLQCAEGLERSVRDGLSKRPGAHRPKKTEVE
jgi:hypothetical protein